MKTNNVVIKFVLIVILLSGMLGAVYGQTTVIYQTAHLPKYDINNGKRIVPDTTIHSYVNGYKVKTKSFMPATSYDTTQNLPIENLPIEIQKLSEKLFNYCRENVSEINVIKVIGTYKNNRVLFTYNSDQPSYTIVEGTNIKINNFDRYLELEKIKHNKIMMMYKEKEKLRVEADIKNIIQNNNKTY